MILEEEEKNNDSLKSGVTACATSATISSSNTSNEP